MGLVLLLLAGLWVAGALVVGATAWSLTHPPRRTYASALARGKPGDPGEFPTPMAFRGFMVRSRGRDLPAWEIAGHDPSGPTIVLTHGWGDSRVGMLTRIGPMARVASRLIAWDLPGHGESAGWCTLGTREAEDLRAVLATVQGPTVMMGSSMGAGITLEAVARWREGEPRGDATVIGMILEAPYAMPWSPPRGVLSAAGLPHRWTVPIAMGLLGVMLGQGWRWDRAGFDRRVWAARVARGFGGAAPLLVVHGIEDRVSPVEDGRAIAAAGGGRIAEVAGAGHHGLWTGEASAEMVAEACRDAVRAWMAGAAR